VHIVIKLLVLSRRRRIRKTSVLNSWRCQTPIPRLVVDPKHATSGRLDRLPSPCRQLCGAQRARLTAFEIEPYLWLCLPSFDLPATFCAVTTGSVCSGISCGCSCSCWCSRLLAHTDWLTRWLPGLSLPVLQAFSLLLGG